QGRGADGTPVAQQAGSVTFEALVRILDRFRSLAEHTRLSIPAHAVVLDGESYRLPVVQPPGDLRSVFKVTSENLMDGDRWEPGLYCYATAQKRYVLTRKVKGVPASAKSSAFVMGTLANFRPGGELDWDAIEEAWRIGPDLAEGKEPEGPVGIDLEAPVLQ